MKRILLLLVLILTNALAAEKTQIQVIKQGEFYDLAGSVSAFGQHKEILLPGVSAYLFYEDRIIDSTSLDSVGEFSFIKLKEGSYDLAFLGNLYFPKKICEIVVDTTQKIYPSTELQNLEEKYPDSTWRPGRYLYVTFKSELTEDEIIRRLSWNYDLEVLPFNNNSVLRPLMRYNGEKLYRAAVILEEDRDGVSLANQLVKDPYVYNVDPDLLLPLPPVVKTNQKARSRK
jgi:hypothetical protein